MGPGVQGAEWRLWPVPRGGRSRLPIQSLAAAGRSGQCSLALPCLGRMSLRLLGLCPRPWIWVVVCLPFGDIEAEMGGWRWPRACITAGGMVGEPTPVKEFAERMSRWGTGGVE